MNLPSSLTKSGQGSKDSQFFNLPIVRRKAVGYEVDDDKLTNFQGKQRDRNIDKIINTDDRGGIGSNGDDDDKFIPLTPLSSSERPPALATLSRGGNDLTRANSITSKREDYGYDEEPHTIGNQNDDRNNDNDQDSIAQRQKWYHKWIQVCRRHAIFIGPGIITCVGYTDPGNWVTDLAAGSQFGYKLLFIVLLSGLFGIFLQILAVRMGVVTGNDLARNTRVLLLPDDDGRLSWFNKDVNNHQTDKVRYRNARILTLWGLYLVSEGALIATELAELLGSAIALNLLFPGLPLYGGVIVTCADVMLFLFVYKPQGNFRIFEFLIAGLVMIVLACYIALLVRTKPNWSNVFDGFVPSSTLVQPEALYTGIGIIGAVIMPHALYLGSHFSTINRMDKSKNALRFDMEPEVNENVSMNGKPWHQRTLHTLRVYIANTFSSFDAHLRNRGHRHPPSPSPSSNNDTPLPVLTDNNKNNGTPWPKRMSIAEIRMHLPHAAWDIALSLFFFAIFINSAILVVAGAAFYYGNNRNANLGDLYDAFNLLKNTLGHVYAILFAIALLAAGQAASITCTLAGQLVSEGFINWRTNPFLRRMITRIITAIPALAIAIGIGRNGLDEMLIASQVVLSFALPFVLVPLILVTSQKSKMCIEDEIDQEANADAANAINESFAPTRTTTMEANNNNLQQAADDTIMPLETPLTEYVSESMSMNPGKMSDNQEVRRRTTAPPESISSSSHKIVHNFTNHWTVIIFSIIIFLIIVLADVYTLVTLFLGEQ